VHSAFDDTKGSLMMTPFYAMAGVLGAIQIAAQ
jgi:hypothetical protein